MPSDLNDLVHRILENALTTIPELHEGIPPSAG